ncbi:vitellogenin-like [Brachyhypopomus gauderio]|uniref:vitellogenin-like n=1 Tax=Brachyhypopomus gauderio TaxID=698409 RepID=UPI004041D7A2
MRAVVLALTVALVASQQINLVPDFVAGKTFVYNYEGRILGGVPQEGLAKAGVKISSKVLISSTAQNICVLKLLEPKLFEYSGVWPEDSFTPATKLTSALKSQLVTPIKFEYSNGVVGKVFAPAGVSSTVLNLHRGILNIFQLNLKKTQHVYELHEDGTQGVCKTHYMIREDGRTNHIAVTKSKDLTDCHERVIKDIGLAYLETCVECQQRLKSQTGTATYTYDMKFIDAQPVVSEARVEEVHEFSAFNTLNGAAQMRANQTLNLLEVQNKPTAPSNDQYSARGNLRYEFGTEILQTPIQLLKINNVQAQIVEVLKHLVENNVNKVHDDAPLKYVQLVQLLRFATMDDIEAIWAQYKTKHDYRRWILDTIPVIGTPVALKFINHKFQADELTKPELIQGLLFTLHMVKANPDTLRMTASLALDPKIKSIAMLRELIMLGYGSMIARYCAEVPSCPADLLKPIHDIVAEATSRADMHELTLALKVLGNAGHPSSIKPIMKLLPGFGSAAANLPMKVKDNAILALRRIAKTEPNMVQTVALQLYMDKTLHPELRMVACILLFDTKPSVALMSTIADALDKEPSMQVTSFTYSHMKSLTRSMAPDFVNVAAAANVAIRILSPRLDRLSFRFSRAFRADVYLSPVMLGAAGSAFIINDGANIVPRAVVAKSRAYLAGAASDVLEVGVRTEGLQQVVTKIQAGNENTDWMTKIKHIMKDWRNLLPTNQPLASMYVKLLGQEIAFGQIDKHLIESVMEQAAQVATGKREYLREIVRALQIGIDVQYSKPMMPAEVRRILPTAVGLPMEFSHYTAAVAAASINVQATITPHLHKQTEPITLDHLRKTNIQLHAEARPSIVMQTFAVIGVNTAFIQAAAIAKGKIHINVPGKLSVKADLPKNNFKVELVPVECPDHVATISFETVAVARNVEDLPSQRVVSLAPPAPSDAQPTWIPTSFQKTVCGVIPKIRTKACLDISFRNAGFIHNDLIYYIVGHHTVRISVMRADGPALERLELEVQLGPEAAEKLSKGISLDQGEGSEERNVLLRLREMLKAGLKNIGSSSSSSSSSISSNQSPSNSSSSSSSKRSRSSSSSSSSSSARTSEATSTRGSFQQFHKNKYLALEEVAGTSSSSFEKQAKLLGDSVPPAFAIIARAVRTDRALGYQLAAYLDKSTSRVQIVFSSTAQNDKWKICADGVLPSKHKIAAKLAWGVDCQEYSVHAKIETGLHESKLAARLKLKWERLPEILNILSIYNRRASDYITVVAPLVGISVDTTNNKNRQIVLIVSISDQDSVNIIFRCPKMTLSRKNVPLPICLSHEYDQHAAL